MILAINTGSDKNSIALYSPLVSDEVVWESYHRQSQELLAKIDKLLKSKKIKLSDLKAIAVFEGPGSYTGLRVGISVANSLAWSLNIPIMGIIQDQKLKTKNQNHKNKKYIKRIKQFTNQPINQISALEIAQRAHGIIKRKKSTTKYKQVEPIYYNSLG